MKSSGDPEKIKVGQVLGELAGAQSRCDEKCGAYLKYGWTSFSGWTTDE